MVTEKRTGHLPVLLAILIWGTTFIFTKILLADFQPMEILFFRFIMGYLILLIAYIRSHIHHRKIGAPVYEVGRKITDKFFYWLYHCNGRNHID